MLTWWLLPEVSSYTCLLEAKGRGAHESVTYKCWTSPGIGCGVLTGAGTVFNSFRDSRVGASIAVFGVGAVGAGAIMAARNGHYSKIIAVDLHPSRLEIAKQVGATHVVDGKDADVAARIMELGGVDYAVEATGVPKVLETAYRSLKKGGTVAIVGIAPFDKTFELPISMHMSAGKNIIGVSLGSAYPKTFIPFLIEVRTLFSSENQERAKSVSSLSCISKGVYLSISWQSSSQSLRSMQL